VALDYVSGALLPGNLKQPSAQEAEIPYDSVLMGTTGPAAVLRGEHGGNAPEAAGRARQQLEVVVHCCAPLLGLLTLIQDGYPGLPLEVGGVVIMRGGVIIV
jgi:hypothetical protein